MSPLLSATNLSKLYGMRPVLRGVSFEVERGEFVAILGANGAGKTTLLRILATLSRPSTGTLTVGGIDALKHPNHARALIGMVSHQSLIYPDLTAYENMRFYGQMYGLGDDGRRTLRHLRQGKLDDGQTVVGRLPSIVGIVGINDRIENALHRVNLWNRKDDFSRTFSRGMIQRLTIARAILHDPPLLLLDEPFTGLDQTSAANLSALLREAALSDRAVVMTTHELSRGLDGVTRALILKGGRIQDEERDDFSLGHLASLLESSIVTG